MRWIGQLQSATTVFISYMKTEGMISFAYWSCGSYIHTYYLRLACNYGTSGGQCASPSKPHHGLNDMPIC